jgi:hypothetical protein
LGEGESERHLAFVGRIISSIRKKNSSQGDAETDIDERERNRKIGSVNCAFHDTHESDSGRLKWGTKECASVHYHA